MLRKRENAGEVVSQKSKKTVTIKSGIYGKMPPKRVEIAQKRKSSASLLLAAQKIEEKRARMSRQGNFRVGDLRAELPYSSDQCLLWFREYADSKSGDSIGPDGMLRLCSALEVDPEDVVMLALAWKLKAAQMGFFSKAEWLKGMHELQCDNTEKLKRRLPHIRAYLDVDSTFKSIYQYSFDFAKNEGQRNINAEMGKALLDLLLESRWPILSSFIDFLDVSKYRVLNRDQWYNILEFSRTIKPDLSNYDVNGAWPVLLDEFVERMQKTTLDPGEADE